MEDKHKIYENKKPIKYVGQLIIITCIEKQISEDPQKPNQHKVKGKTTSSSWKGTVRR